VRVRLQVDRVPSRQIGQSLFVSPGDHAELLLCLLSLDHDQLGQIVTIDVEQAGSRRCRQLPGPVEGCPEVVLSKPPRGRDIDLPETQGRFGIHGGRQQESTVRSVSIQVAGEQVHG